MLDCVIHIASPGDEAWNMNVCTLWCTCSYVRTAAALYTTAIRLEVAHAVLWTSQVHVGIQYTGQYQSTSNCHGLHACDHIIGASPTLDVVHCAHVFVFLCARGMVSEEWVTPQSFPPREEEMNTSVSRWLPSRPKASKIVNNTTTGEGVWWASGPPREHLKTVTVIITERWPPRDGIWATTNC